MIEFEDSSLPIIVITTETSWLEPPRMRHYVSQQLSSKFNVLYFELDSKGVPEFYKVSKNLFIYRLGFMPKGINRFFYLRILWNYLQALRIWSIVRKIKYTNLVLLNFKFDFYQIYKNKNWSLKYYFINDDFINMVPNSSERTKNKKRLQQNIILRECDRIFLSSEFLLDDNQRQNLNCTTILSGHDFQVKYITDKKVKTSKLIKLCLMGFIDDNLEIEWLEELQYLDLFELHFVGPIISKHIFNSLKKIENVFFHSPLVGKDLQDFLSKYDVMLMPYKPIQINLKASVPAKLFQYLACGKPIVSSFMPNLINLPNSFVYQSDNKLAFIDSILKAYSEDSVELYNSRCRFASEHTWNNRGEMISKIIFSDLSKKN